jgi:hypothetical protein
VTDGMRCDEEEVVVMMARRPGYSDFVDVQEVN